MEIDWKYDDLERNIIRCNTLITFEFEGKYIVGIINALSRDKSIAFVDRPDDAYSVPIHKIIAWANIDAIRPAKPKPKFPDGALTWDEIKEINHKRNRLHIWVKFLNTGGYWPAIIDCIDGDYAIIWCASNENNWLRGDGYGKDYVCYLDKPNEG